MVYGVQSRSRPSQPANSMCRSQHHLQRYWPNVTGPVLCYPVSLHLPSGNEEMGTLFVIGTPIGNLEDLTFRAGRVLGQVALVAAEDTRVTRKLLNHLGLRVPITSYHQHNGPRRTPEILEALNKGDVALVTDAGMPGVSDPGSELVARAAAEGFNVEVVPGVSSVTTALAVAGLPADSFQFLGFLPRRSAHRRRQLLAVKDSPSTLVIFEAPHRLGPTLKDLQAVLGDREAAVCRELTKMHEEVFRGTLSEAVEHFTQPRGEFVLVVAGAAGTGSCQGGDEAGMNDQREQREEAALARLAELRRDGVAARDAVAEVSRSTGQPRNDIYRLWLSLP